MAKKLVIFLVLLIFWFISGVMFPIDIGYYLSLNIPKFILPSSIIGIIWIIIYFLNSLSIYKVIKDFEPNNNYLFTLSLNYLFCQIFPLFFFYIQSFLLSLISTIGTLITAYFLMKETPNEDSKKLLYPYIGWSYIFLIYLIIICIIN